MDARTLKIRDLKHKLESARDFIRNLVFYAAECQGGQTLKNEYVIKEGVRKLEYTKE